MDVLFLIHDPEGYAAAAAEREAAEQKQQSAERMQTLLELGGEIG